MLTPRRTFFATIGRLSAAAFTFLAAGRIATAANSCTLVNAGDASDPDFGCRCKTSTIPVNTPRFSDTVFSTACDNVNKPPGADYCYENPCVATNTSTSCKCSSSVTYQLITCCCNDSACSCETVQVQQAC